MNEKKDIWQKYPVLFSLYISQSVPMSFFTVAVPVLLYQSSFSLFSVGLLIGLFKLPWILKFLWAPLIDKYSRTDKDLRKLILLAQLIYAALIFSLYFLQLETDFLLIIILLVLAFTASATQDIATDAFAILNLEKKERAYGNSIQSAGKFIGAVIGTGVMLILFRKLGWQNTILILSLFLCAGLLPLFFYKKGVKVNRKEAKNVKLSDIFTFFTQKGIGMHILLLLFYFSGVIGMTGLLKSYLISLNYEVKEIGFMSGIVGVSSAAIASIFGGYIVKKIKVRKAMLIFLAPVFFAALHFGIISQGEPSLNELYYGICLLWASYGFSAVVIYTKSMNVVRKNREGTDFTLQMVIAHLSGIVMVIFSHKIAGKFGFTAFFLFDALLVVLTAGLVLFANYKELKKELRGEVAS